MISPLPKRTVGNFGGVIAARNEVGPSGGSRVFRGLIDEVRVYEGTIDPRRFAVERDNLAPATLATPFVTIGPEQRKAP